MAVAAGAVVGAAGAVVAAAGADVAAGRGVAVASLPQAATTNSNADIRTKTKIMALTGDRLFIIDLSMLNRSLAGYGKTLKLRVSAAVVDTEMVPISN